MITPDSIMGFVAGRLLRDVPNMDAGDLLALTDALGIVGRRADLNREAALLGRFRAACYLAGESPAAERWTVLNELCDELSAPERFARILERMIPAVARKTWSGYPSAQLRECELRRRIGRALEWSAPAARTGLE